MRTNTRNAALLWIALLSFVTGAGFGLVVYILLRGRIQWISLPAAAAACTLTWGFIAWSRQTYFGQQSSRLAEEARFKDAILRFVKESTGLDTRESLYNLILETAVEAIPHAINGSLLKVVDGKDARFEAAFGHDMSILRNLTLRLDETFNHVLTDGKCDRTVIVRDYQALNRKILDSDQYDMLEAGTADISASSIMSAPVHVDDQLWGMLTIDSAPGFGFETQHIEKLDVFVNETVKIIRHFREQERNVWLMRHDTLTGLFNRPYFTERLKVDLAAAAEGKHIGTLVSMDLDNFKHINDAFGHVSGDQALIHFAQVFSGFLGENDYLSRYGGDEYVAVFMGKNTAETEAVIRQVEEKLRQNPLRIGEHKEQLRFSFGLVTFDTLCHDHQQIMHTSDAFMYACKREHREKRW